MKALTLILLTIGFNAACFAEAAPELPNITCHIDVVSMSAPWTDTAVGPNELSLDVSRPSDVKVANLSFRMQKFSVVLKSARNEAGRYTNYQILAFDEENPKPNDAKYYFAHILGAKNQYFPFDGGLQDFGSLTVPLRQVNGILEILCRGTKQ